MLKKVCLCRFRTRPKTTSGIRGKKSAMQPYEWFTNHQTRRRILVSLFAFPISRKSEDDAINRGIEVQIDESGDDWHTTGVLYSMTQAKARPSKPVGEWNTLEITMQGPRTIVKLNGTLVTDYDGVSPVPPKRGRYEPERGPRPDTGYIAIQHHGGAATIWFREISLVTAK